MTVGNRWAMWWVGSRIPYSTDYRRDAIWASSAGKVKKESFFYGRILFDSWKIIFLVLLYYILFSGLPSWIQWIPSIFLLLILCSFFFPALFTSVEFLSLSLLQISYELNCHLQNQCYSRYLFLNKFYLGVC